MKKLHLRIALLAGSILLSGHVRASESAHVANNTEQGLPNTPINAAQSTTVWSNVLQSIPNALDATAQVLPAESNLPNVPPITETQDRSWLDQQQKTIRNWADDTSQRLDAMVGKPDPKRPASATLRVLLDQAYTAQQDYEVKLRLRGKIRLPSLEKRLSLVFGDERLDNEFPNSNSIVDSNTAAPTDANQQLQLSRQQIQQDNNSVALRFSQWSKRLPFDNDLDLGIRSGDDVYLRMTLEKDWNLQHDWQFYAAQIYRYGLQSENFWRTNLQLGHIPAGKAKLYNQLNFTLADEIEEDLVWDNRLFRQHQFFAEHRLNYGLYTGGYVDHGRWASNQWGPYVSWRQPLWREWFFVQFDVNYFDDDRLKQPHQISTALRLETLF